MVRVGPAALQRKMTERRLITPHPDAYGREAASLRHMRQEGLLAVWQPYYTHADAYGLKMFPMISVV